MGLGDSRANLALKGRRFFRISMRDSLLRPVQALYYWRLKYLKYLLGSLKFCAEFYEEFSGILQNKKKTIAVSFHTFFLCQKLSK